MPDTLAEILRERKASIATQLHAIQPAPHAGASDNAGQAMALARVDSLISMLQQSPDMLVQTLRGLAQSQVRGSSDNGALEEIQQEHFAASEAVGTASMHVSAAIALLDQLNRLTLTRMRVTIDEIQQRTNQQLQETIADKQALRAAVQELSTPIIPLYSGILVLPLVGQIDDARAQDITESLLEAIAREQADMVLLDVTGILTIDTSVANHLMQTARAAALLGSQVILVGISAEIAQTLVQMNVDLGTLVTLSDLQSGVEFALDRLGLAIRPKA